MTEGTCHDRKILDHHDTVIQRGITPNAPSNESVNRGTANFAILCQLLQKSSHNFLCEVL